jgi:outer membrane protein assembly factor BamD (BamD/ComL family)
MLESIATMLRPIIETYPDTGAAKRASMMIAEVYMLSKNYDQARNAANAIIASYPDDPLLLSTAYFLRGLTYEKQNQWNRALKEFNILQDKYINTTIGIQAPLYVARYYIKEKQTVRAEKAYSDAIRLYERLRKENERSMFGYAASNMLAVAYMEQSRYDEMGSVIEDMIMNYPSEAVFQAQIPNIEFAFVKTLDKPEKARELYAYIEKTTRNPRLKALLQRRLKKWEAAE